MVKTVVNLFCIDLTAAISKEVAIKTKKLKIIKWIELISKTSKFMVILVAILSLLNQIWIII